MSRARVVRAYVGLGSNLANPALQVRVALRGLETLAGSRLAAASSLYRNPPMGPADQPDYVNAVARLDTTLAAADLLAALQALEAAQGRVRDGRRWGPRVIDLDLLLYGDLRLDLPGLTVPHPGLPHRAFVLYPLREIAPGLSVPGLGSVEALAGRAPGPALEPMEAVAVPASG